MRKDDNTLNIINCSNSHPTNLVSQQFVYSLHHHHIHRQRCCHPLLPYSLMLRYHPIKPLLK